MTGFNTRAIHAGQEPDRVTGAVVPPLFLTTTFRQDVPGEPLGGFEYSRCANPTRSALEANLASLEGERTPIPSPAGWRPRMHSCGQHSSLATTLS